MSRVDPYPVFEPTPEEQAAIGHIQAVAAALAPVAGPENAALMNELEEWEPIQIGAVPLQDQEDIIHIGGQFRDHIRRLPRPVSNMLTWAVAYGGWPVVCILTVAMATAVEQQQPLAAALLAIGTLIFTFFAAEGDIVVGQGQGQGQRGRGRRKHSVRPKKTRKRRKLYTTRIVRGTRR
jgi:hypothetical protein